MVAIDTKTIIGTTSRSKLEMAKADYRFAVDQVEKLALTAAYAERIEAWAELVRTQQFLIDLQSKYIAELRKR